MWAININFGFVNMWKVYKAIKLDKVFKGMRRDRKESRLKD